MSTAKISDGHNIRLGGSEWDTTFEHYFDRPDSAFPQVVDWLQKTAQKHTQCATDFMAHDVELKSLSTLCECLLSLVLRAPMFRHQILSLLGKIRTHLPKEEHKLLIAANLRQVYHQLTTGMLGDGKFLVLLSREREFIYGDGVYNNLSPNSMHLAGVRLAVPLTPELAVIYARPMQYMVEPRLVTRIADAETIQLINETTQIYSRDYLFFRTQKPVLIEHFQKREHLRYGDGDPIRSYINDIPGACMSTIIGGNGT